MSDLKYGAIAWVDLTVPNAPALRDFYAAVAGWSPQDVKVGDYADFTMRTSGSYGDFAVIQDPAGAVMALIQPKG